MGTAFRKTSSQTPCIIITDSKVSNIKLEAAKITEFFGRIDEFQAWRIRTEYAFDGSVFEKILIDKSFARENPRINRIVFS